MNPSPSTRPLDVLRGVMPGVITVTLVLASFVPLGIPHFALVFPMTVMMSVYYWSMYRPDLLPMPVIFLIGVFQDVLSGAPIGLSSLVLLTVHWVCLSQRRFIVGKAFLVEWSGFALTAFGAAVLGWLIISVYHLAAIGPGAFAVQFILSVATYPAIAWLFGRGEQVVLRTS